MIPSLVDWCTVLAGLAAVIWLVFFLESRGAAKLGRSCLPPGNLGWPVLGESLKYASSNYAVGTPSPFLSKRLQCYGTIFKTHLAGSPTIVSADPELNNLLLRSEGNLVRTCQPRAAKNIVGSFLEISGAQHKRFRNAVISLVNSAKLQQHFLKDAQDHALWILKPWEGKGLVYAQDEARKYIFNFVAMKFSSLQPGDPVASKMMEDYAYFIRGIHSLPIKIPGTAYSLAMKARRNIRKVVKNLIDERRRNEVHVDIHDDDLLDIVLRDVDEAGQPYPEQDMLDLVAGVIFAGYQTASVLLTMVIKFITDHPKVLQELQGEHTRVRKTKKENEKLTWDDYKGMHFTQNVINETLRLANVVHLIPREALQDISFKGITIPKGWKVFLHISTVHLDPSLYPDPLEFNPWRWQEAAAANYNCFAPFGGGLRICVGAELARLEVAVFVHYLVTLYRWEVAEYDQGYAYPMPTMVKGLPIRIQSI